MPAPELTARVGLLAAGPWATWSLPPLVLVAAFVAAALFGQGWLRLRSRRRADLAPWTRLGLFAAGSGIVTLALVSPLDAVGEEYLQAAHMLQHVLIADLGIVLVLLALRGPLAFFFLPRRLLAPLARSGWLRAAVAWALRPGWTFVLWIGVLVAWHIPALYEAALRRQSLHDIQHASLMLVGALLWTNLLDPTHHRRSTVAERVGLAAAAYASGLVLAYVMAFGGRPFYGVYADQRERLLGLSPLGDQKLAAVVMMVEQTLTLGTFLLVYLWRRSGMAGAASEPQET